MELLSHKETRKMRVEGNETKSLTRYERRLLERIHQAEADRGFYLLDDSYETDSAERLVDAGLARWCDVWIHGHWSYDSYRTRVALTEAGEEVVKADWRAATRPALDCTDCGVPLPDSDPDRTRCDTCIYGEEEA